MKTIYLTCSCGIGQVYSGNEKEIAIHNFRATHFHGKISIKEDHFADVRAMVTGCWDKLKYFVRR